MNEDEAEVFHVQSNSFYREYKALVEKYIEAAPEHLREEMRQRISELSNPYSV
jgi:hypothetical protein